MRDSTELKVRGWRDVLTRWKYMSNRVCPLIKKGEDDLNEEIEKQRFFG